MQPPRFTFVLAAALVLLLRPQVRADELTKAEVARIGKAATVFVAARGGTGSGFCVHSSGLFVTNAHVVGGDTEVTVVFNASLPDQKILKAKVLRTDKPADLALLKVDDQKDLPALALGAVDKLAELSEVVACSFPLGKRLAMEKNEFPPMSINSGSITALRLKEGVLDKLQLDVAVTHGNSGGPLIDRGGKVVGVIDSGIPGVNINFAIPVTHVTKFLDRPDFTFTPPVVNRANQHEPAEFQARVVSVIPPPRPVSLELVLQAGAEPERRLKMALKDGVYRVSAPPVPKEDVRRLELSAQFETGTVDGVVEDREIQVGERKVKLSACQRFQLQPRPVVFLIDGKTVEGALTGLGKIDIAVGGQTLTVSLDRATSLVVRVPKPALAIECTLVAKQGDTEVGRHLTRLPIRGVTLVEAADLSGAGIIPARIGAEKVVKKLPDIAADLRVGGGGRYLVLHLPKLKKLAVFDVNAATIVRYIPLAEDKIVYAAGLDRVVIGLTAKGVVETWDLNTGEKVLARAMPDGADIYRVLLGSASHGPVLVNDAFYDLDSLKPLPIKFPRGVPAPWSPVSADGTVFGSWKTNQSPAESTTFVLQGDELQRYDEGGTGHVSPGPDGRTVYTAAGPRTNRLKSLGETPAKPVYTVPAVEGNFYLALTTAEGGKGGSLSVYMLGSDQPVVKDTGIAHGVRFDGWDRELFGPWRRIFFIPRANLIVVFPDGNDRLELYPFDVEAALEKSGLDYLLVTSRPPTTAKPGTDYSYQLATKSKKGDVKYVLSSGPEGMEVSPSGRVKWRVPADYKPGEAEVLITVRDGAGQEVFHTFTIRITDG